MPRLLFISHPEVILDPDLPITSWSLNATGYARAQAFAASPEMQDVTRIVSSAENKALQTARIFANRLGLSATVDHRLGENDRSATGYLPPEEFEAAACAFFANPDDSFRGWETAVAAQKRITEAIVQLCGLHRQGDLAVVSHGAVGTLLYCALTQEPISRDFDQPGQGHYFAVNLPAFAVVHGWQSIA